MRVHHLSCGSLCPRGAWLIPEFEASFSLHVLLIETPSAGLVLVDTGLGDGASRSPRRALGLPALTIGARPDPSASVVEQVRRRGFDPADVRHIVPTHLDFDHAGGLPDFPHATVHVQQIELDAARARDKEGFTKVRYSDRVWAHGPRWEIYDDDRGTGGWMGLEGVRPLNGLPPELQIVPLPGHTVGHVGVLIDRGDGTFLIHAGDAYTCRREVTPGRRSLRVRAYHHLTDEDYLARKNMAWHCERWIRFHPEIDVISSHDPFEMAAWRGA